MNQKQKEIRMYGISVDELREDIENSITFKFSGPAMIAMSMMSDAQEILFHSEQGLSRSTFEDVRQTLNRAKWVISTYMMERTKQSV